MSRRGAMRMFSGFQKPLAILAALARSGKGNVLPMTAAAIFLLAGMVGGGVDVSRAYMTKNRLQNACDAAALATRHGVAVNLTWAQATAQGQVYFKNNFDNTQEGVTAGSFDPETPDDGNTVNGTATATLPTIVMNLFGYKQTTLNVTCTASMGVGNSDITFVLDNTASMTWVVGSDKTPGKGQDSRMDELKDAMDSFYDTIAAATSASNARIRYSYVTYGATVNVGQVLNDLDSDYLSDTSSSARVMIPSPLVSPCLNSLATASSYFLRSIGCGGRGPDGLMRVLSSSSAPVGMPLSRSSCAIA